MRFIIQSEMKKKEIKLLIVGSFPKDGSNIIGGIKTSCDLLIAQGFKKGFRLSTIDSTQISNPPPNIFIRFYYAGIRLIFYFYKLLLFRPDCVLLFFSDGASAFEKGLMNLTASLLKIKTIVFPRAGKLISQYHNKSFFRKSIRMLFSTANIFLSQGKEMSLFAKNDLKFESNMIHEIFNWTATNELLEIGKTKILQKKVYEIIFVGWVESYKGIQELIEVLGQLKADGYEFKLLIAGDGSIKKDMQDLTFKLNLKREVFFLGWLNKNELYSQLKSADLFVLPSWSEGFPNSIVEAMSSKVPIISTNVGTIPGHIKNQENGLLINKRNQNELKRAIELLINNHSLRHKIAENGYDYARKHFSTKENIDRLEKIIINICK